MIKYPEIIVQLTGEEGNAFAILGRVSRAMRQAGLNQAQINEYTNEAMAGTYDDLLQATLKYVTVQ